MSDVAFPGLEITADYGLDPTHIVDETGKRLCGRRDAYPIVGIEFVDAHVQGHGLVVCPDCQLRR